MTYPENGRDGTSDGLMPQGQGAVTPHTTTDAGDDMSDDIRAKAQTVINLYGTVSLPADLARQVLATEARLDVALRGALQSREEMREWLGSGEVWRVIDQHRRLDIFLCVCGVSWNPEHVAAALIDAMPGGDA